jgi:hypothetical protein
MFAFIPQVESPKVVLEKHLSVKAAAEFSGMVQITHIGTENCFTNLDGSSPQSGAFN